MCSAGPTASVQTREAASQAVLSLEAPSHAGAPEGAPARITYYAGLYGASAAFLKLTGFAIFLWLARALTIGEYAKFGLLYATQQVIVTFASAGIMEAVVGLLKEHAENGSGSKVFARANRAFVIVAASAVVTALVARLVLSKSMRTTGAEFFEVLGSGTLLAFAMFQGQMARLEEQHVSGWLFGLLPQLLAFVGSAAAFAIAETPQSYFLGAIIGAACGVAALWPRCVGMRHRDAHGPPVRLILLRAAPFVFVAFLGWLSGYGNNYVANFFFQSAEVAKFTLALSLCGTMLLVAGAVNQVWCPRFYRLAYERPFLEVERANRQFYRLLAGVLGAFGGIVIIVFPIVVEHLRGNLLTYGSMSVPLALLFGGYVLLTPWWQCLNHFLANAQGRSVLHITVATSAVGFSLLVAIIWRFGSIGIYVGFLVQMLVRSMGIVWIARRRWPIDVSASGIAVGLALIGLGCVFASFGMRITLALAAYAILCLALASTLFRRDLAWAIRA